jgi:uncharacterized protein
MKIASEGGLAVITGAAGGLGSSFANKLAKRGHRLLLVDRRLNQLEQVCESITALHGVPAEPCAVDLCKREEVDRLGKRLEQIADVDLLVNNAGFGSLEYFVDAPAKSLLDMVDVHVAAPTILTRAVIPGMIERNRGAIINVSSVSAWLQSAGNVQYGATKTYLAVFSVALHQELRGTNIRVQALCPGFTRTEFHDAECMKRFEVRGRLPEYFWMSADEVVDCSLRKLSGSQVVITPGLGYPVFGRLAQMPLLKPLMQWAMRGSRLAPSTLQAADSCPAPVLRVAKSI